MSWAVEVPVVVVCSESDHRQEVQVAAAVDVESPPVLQLRRRSANYEPTTWDYDAIVSSLSRRPLSLPLPLPLGSEQAEEEEDHDDANHLQLVATFKDSVRRMLLQLQQEEDADNGRSRRPLRTIHQLQSLGIAYHFDQEIRGILMSMHHHHDHLDLHSAALLFRMLRELGIPASTGV